MHGNKWMNRGNETESSSCGCVCSCDFLVDMGEFYDILVRFRAIASSTARSCLSNSSRRDDFFDAAAFAFSMAALDGGITCAPPPLPSLLFFESFLPMLDDLVDFSGARIFALLPLPRDELDELEEYELSEPESLESDEPDPDELEARRCLVATALCIGGDSFRFVVTTFSTIRFSTTGDATRLSIRLLGTGDPLRARRGLTLGERVRITLRTCVVPA